MKNNALLLPADLLCGARAEIAAGDIVQTSANCYPRYRVVAVAADRAWLRDTQHATDHIVPVDRCRKIESQGA